MEQKKIFKTSAETRETLKKRSAYSLPNRPSASGMTAEQIKKHFWQPLLADDVSIITELDRIVDAANECLQNIYNAIESGTIPGDTEGLEKLIEELQALANAASEKATQAAASAQQASQTAASVEQLVQEIAGSVQDFEKSVETLNDAVDALNTGKVNVSDIINDLVSSAANKPLSAAQGVVLKGLIDAITVPTKTSQLENDSGYLTQHQDLSAYAKKSTTLAGYGITDATTKLELSAHNTDEEAHNDLRLRLDECYSVLKRIADSTDEDLDQLSEMVAYIKSNRSLIENITTEKVNKADIIDNLVTNLSNKVLSAAQGVVLKGLIDQLSANKLNASAIADDLTTNDSAKVLSAAQGVVLKALIDGLTTNKISTADIANNLTTSSATKVLSAAQGVALKSLIDALTTNKLNASDLPTAVNQALAQAKASGEFDGEPGKTAYQYAKDGGYTGTEEDFSKMLAGDVIPEYWSDHISTKIKSIKTLQDNGGKDCFSFVVITDIHHPANLGKRSPTIAKRILDECDIKYAMCLGDTQTRACHSTKEQILSENEKIEKMLHPIRDRLLQTQGNHDGNYGVINNVTYVYSLTKGEMHSAIYRKVGLVGDCHFDESGTGYYIDDTANKVRYIVLNTHNTSYETNEDGTQKYSPMSVWRYTQSQFDMLIEALETIPSDLWSVVVSAHVPLTRTEIGDRAIMMGVLKAYKDKTTYLGEYLGTASASATYTNQLQIATDGSGNVYNSVGFKNKSRLNSSGVVKDYTDGNAFVTGFIPVKAGDIIRLNGNYIKADATGVGALNWWFYTNFSSAISACTMDYINSAYFTNVKTNSEGYVTEFSISPTSTFQNAAYMRLTLLGEGENCIITVNEEIVDSAHGYDYVSVDVDFSNAKGNLVGYFAGHSHADTYVVTGDIPVITTRCDGMEENTADLKAERIAGTTTEQSFDVFTVNTATRTIYATKIGAGSDRTITY